MSSFLLIFQEILEKYQLWVSEISTAVFDLPIYDSQLKEFVSVKLNFDSLGSKKPRSNKPLNSCTCFLKDGAHIDLDGARN
jgi:hypothetical protein